MVVDSSDEEVEDEFDVTLRTPCRPTGHCSEPGTPESPAPRASVPRGPQPSPAAGNMLVDSSSSPRRTKVPVMTTSTPGDKKTPIINSFVTAPSPARASPTMQHSIAVQNIISTASDAAEKVPSELASGSAIESSLPPAPAPLSKPPFEPRKRRLPAAFDLVDPPRATKRRVNPGVVNAEPAVKPSHATIRRIDRADDARSQSRCADGSANHRKPLQQAVPAPRTYNTRATTVPRSESSTRLRHPTTTRMAAAPPPGTRTRMSTLAQPSAAAAATDRTRSRAQINARGEKAPPLTRRSVKRIGNGESRIVGGALKEREPAMEGSTR